MNECAKSHDWSPTGLYVDGIIHRMCKRPDCKMEQRQVWIETIGPGLSVDGIDLDIEDDPQGGVAKVICREAQGKYDKLNLQPGDVVIDIGAHVGIVSIYLAKRYPGIKVYAFEPVPANYQRLCRNLHANGAEGVIAVNKAVTGDGRSIGIAVQPEINTGGGSMLNTATKSLIASSCTLSDIFGLYVQGRAKLLKIDCEGAEYEILQGSEALLDRVDYLRGEFHANRTTALLGYSPEKLLAMCQKHIKPANIDVTFCRMGD